MQPQLRQIKDTFSTSIQGKQFQIGVGTYRVSPKAIEYVNKVLLSERLSYGPYTQRFEREFASSHDCRFGIMTNSGTSSLLIALHALKIRHGWKDGDEVIVPAVTFVATANVVLQLNLKPVFVDVDPIYYELDPALVENAITPRTKCLIPVHLFGLPCDMGALTLIAQRHNLSIVEDSCETMFTRQQNQSVGSLGDIGCFSTYMAHILCTGVGGLCTTNNPELAILLRSLANHGRDSIYISIDDDKNKSEEELRMIIRKRFSFVEPGYSFRVTEMEGALGLAELEKAPEILLKRRENGAYFTRALKDLDGRIQLPQIRPNSEHAFMMYPVVLKHESKEGLVNHLEAAGIETRDMLPLVNQPIYKNLLGTKESDYPVAKWINQSGFYFACHQDLANAEKEYILEQINKYFKNLPQTKEKSSVIVFSRAIYNKDLPFLVNFTDSLVECGFDEFIFADGLEDVEMCQFFHHRGYKVISEKSSKGKLLRKAVEITRNKYIVTIGVDGSDNPRDCARLLTHLKKGNDVVVATRFAWGAQREVNRPFSSRSFGNRLFSFLMSLVSGQNVTDCYNGFRGFRRDAFLKLALSSDGPEVMAEMTAKSFKWGLKYAEEITCERKSVLPYKKTNRLISSLRLIKIIFTR